ncbi:YcgL domain-containing protein [Celerinatantimonas yamalensis]|uniref:YcgL domain-containing protein ABUE30_02855 n=1 Tax=Celerinatantimonas yamalensis TaxID=559956 RepID=A0ABW9G3U4_9GAMM
MLCYVYKSLKKTQTYLYIAKRDDFNAVPEQLLMMIGKLQLFTTINLAKQQLATANTDKVIESLHKEGFYLQLPPPPENELEAYKARKANHCEN